MKMKTHMTKSMGHNEGSPEGTITVTSAHIKNLGYIQSIT